MRATWANTVVAESDYTVVIEGNHYFPPQSSKGQYFQPSSTHTTCPWKGIASYYTLKVDGLVNPDAAWFYPEPKDAASSIRNYIASWRGVRITE